MDLEARYELLETIGSGSYAKVYRARDLELGREVAIKQIHEQYLADADLLNRYWQEAQLLASLHHPNIVTIFDIYRERGWLILELMHGNLAERAALRPMDLGGVRTTLAHCLRALKYLHAQGIVHGDVKPSNMMIDARRRIKLGDFGLARRVSDEDGSLLKGTTKYMAPETVSDEFGEVGPASDLYSLGFSAYELMCGPNFETLFPGLSAFGRNKQVAWMMWHAAADRRLPEIRRVLEGVPADLARVVQRLCEKDQSTRYHTADEALSDLSIDVKLVKTPDSEEDETPAAASSAPDRKRLLIAGGAFAMSLLMSLTLLFWPGGGSRGPENMNVTSGVVEELFLDDNRLKIQDLSDGRPVEIDVGARPRIFLRGVEKNILLRELKPGDRVEIEETFDDRGNRVVNVTASRPESNRGRIRSLDLSASRLVVALEEGGLREDLKLRVPKQASLTLNGRPVALRDLRADDQVEVSHLDEPGERGGRVVHSLAAMRTMETAGFVESYDNAGNTLSIRFGKSDSSDGKTLPIASGAPITVQGGTASLSPGELRPGDRVRVRYDVAVREIIVTRDKQQLSGAVADLNLQNRMLSAQTASGRRVSFHVPESSDVTINLETAQLADLRTFDSVDVTYDESNPQQPAATTIDARRPVRSDRWAIIIGAEGYNSQFLTRLDYSLRNANAFRDALVNRYAFASDRVLTLVNPTREAMQTQIAAKLKEALQPTQVLIYVSAHAFVGDDNRVYLAGKDFNWDRPSETGLSLDWLVEQLEACAAESKLLMLDTCHRGLGKDLERQPSSAQMVERLSQPPRTTSVIASCREGQRGLIWKEKQQGLFSYYLCEAFRGPADVDRDLRITASELIKYLEANMRRVTIDGQTQSPALFGAN